MKKQIIYFTLFLSSMFLSISSNGQAMKINSTGDVGIGREPNIYYDLSVDGDIRGYSDVYGSTFFGNYLRSNYILPRVYNDRSVYLGDYYNAVIINGSAETINALKVNGRIYATGSIVQNSDSRLKKNIIDIDRFEILKKIKKIKGKKYNFKNRSELLELEGDVSFSVDTMLLTGNIIDESIFDQVITKDSLKYGIRKNVPIYDDKILNYGFIAQDIKEVFPNMVYLDPSTNIYSINYIGFIPILMEAASEQLDIIKKLRKKIIVLGDKVSALEGNSSITGEVEEGDNITKLYKTVPNSYTSNTEIKYTLSDNITGANIYIYNLNGLQLKSYPVNKGDSGSVTISASELNAGMYIYSLIANGRLIGSKRMVLTN